jgi:hypothetical protein
MTRNQAYAFRDAVHTQREAVGDQTAARSTAVYDTWEYLVEIGYTAEKAGYRFRYGDRLYKTRLDAQRFAAEWVPGTSTGALYEAIDIEHAGTVDDPIPYAQGMTLDEGKYYREDGVTYLCTRNSGTPIYHSLASLVGLYVEVA